MEPNETTGTEPQETAQPPVKTPEEPRGDSFSQEKFAKAMVDFDIFGPDEVKAAPAPAGEPAKKPCSGCDDEGRSPIATLKVKGKDVNVYTQEELVELAQKGTHYTQERQKDAEWEKELQAKEAELSRILNPLKNIAASAKVGETGETAAGVSRDDIQALMDSDLVDPEVKAALAGINSKLSNLEQENMAFKGQTREAAFEKITQVFDGVFTKVREQFPFDDVEIDGVNVMPELYAGLVSTMANNDRMHSVSDKEFKPRSAPQLMAEAGRLLNAFEKHYQSKFSGNGVSGEAAKSLTAEQLTAMNPALVKSIKDAAVVEYLDQSDREAPVARTTRTDQVHDLGGAGKSKEFTGLDDALSQALDDPDIQKTFDDLGRQSPHRGR